ncbi:MAG: hypothetical protein P8Y75_10520 [Nitrospirota bacterium]|jgi:uncharacterized protein (TIGR00725 family)
MEQAQGMKLKIGVMGSATGVMSRRQRELAFHLGRAIAGADCITITGGAPGLPYEAARGAKSAGGLVVGISPGLSLWEHVNKYHSPTEHHDVLIFTGSGLMGREVVNIRSSDIVVIVGGRSGTLGEFSIAYDEGKLIGVLEGTGGITTELRDIVKAVRKKTGSKLIYDPDPASLVGRLLAYYQGKHYVRPSCFVDVEPRPGGSTVQTLRYNVPESPERPPGEKK